VGGLRGGRGQGAAPARGVAGAFDLERVEPFFGMGKIVARAKAAAGCAEVEARADLDEALGPGETLELDVGEPPHGASPAIGADEIAAAKFYALAVHIGERTLDVVGGLLEAAQVGQGA